MSIYERQTKILEYLKKNNFATIKELAGIVWSSESSVRRDIKILESNGYVNQTYGGVVLSDHKYGVVPLNLRDSSRSDIKDALAKQASEHIFDGATIMMDGSSTVRRILKYLDKFNGLKIITNNQRIFAEYSNSKHEFYCTGGRFVPQSNIFVGSSAENFIRTTHADILFFSSQALSNDGEISDVSEEEISLRRIMIERSKLKIFLCDSSKLGTKKTFTLCTKDDIDKIICDILLPWE